MILKSKFEKSPYAFFAMSGLLGGLAEIAWLYIYNLNGVNGLKEISNEITRTLHISASGHYIGLIIHLTLSVLIGLAYGKLIFEKFCKNNLLLIMISSLFILANIWFFSFKLILPILNTDMTNIVPEAISFTSKMLFGIFMALSYYFFRFIRSL